MKYIRLHLAVRDSEEFTGIGFRNNKYIIVKNSEADCPAKEFYFYSANKWFAGNPKFGSREWIVSSCVSGGHKLPMYIKKEMVNALNKNRPFVVCILANNDGLLYDSLGQVVWEFKKEYFSTSEVRKALDSAFRQMRILSYKDRVKAIDEMLEDMGRLA